MSKRLHSFKQHCERVGLELLFDDYRFIDRSLDNFKKIEFKAVLTRYTEEWARGMAGAKTIEQEQGCGRRMANTWLLQYSEERRRENKKNESASTKPD